MNFKNFIILEKIFQKQKLDRIKLIYSIYFVGHWKSLVTILSFTICVWIFERLIAQSKDSMRILTGMVLTCLTLTVCRGCCVCRPWSSCPPGPRWPPSRPPRTGTGRSRCGPPPGPPGNPSPAPASRPARSWHSVVKNYIPSIFKLLGLITNSGIRYLNIDLFSRNWILL